MANRDIWYAIVNPNAGAGRTMPEWQKAEKLFRREAIRYIPVQTKYPGHAVELVCKGAARGFRKFIAVGGDGTAHEVLNGIMTYYESTEGVSLRDFTLCVLPIGSGNDWIKAQDIPHDTEKVVSLISRGKFTLQDVVKVKLCSRDDGPEDTKTSYMLNVGGVGFDARVCDIVNSKKAAGQGGKMLYVRALLKVISNFYSFPCEVHADGKKIFEGDCYSIAFGIGQYSGGGMRQVPLAVTDDGLLDILVVPKLPISYILKQLPRLFNGTVPEAEKLISLRAKTYDVLPLSDLVEPIEVDGEVIGRFPVSLEVLDEKLNVLTGK